MMSLTELSERLNDVPLAKNNINIYFCAPLCAEEGGNIADISATPSGDFVTLIIYFIFSLLCAEVI